MKKPDEKIQFFNHDLGEEEINSLREVFKSPILTTGEKVTQFEALFSAYLGRKHTIGLTSATAALHLGLLALGIGPGDEVITTPLTFIASSTSILHTGATPVFVDVEPDTGNIDASKIEAAITSRTKAILPVHLYGQMCDMKAIRKIADKHRLKIVEDCAHCIEGVRDGIRPGQLSDLACFSFFATKNITSGEGGALVTDSTELNEKVRLLSLHGMNKSSIDRFRDGYKHWDMTLLGWKYNMSNIQAAFLVPQMSRIEQSLRAREELARRYDSELSKVHRLRLPAVRPGTHARHLYTVWVPANSRDAVIEGLKQKGVPATVNYRAIHLLTYFRELLKHKEGSFPIAEQIGNQTLSLPFYPTMPVEHVDYVSESLKEVLSSQHV